jgi:hypothetical protein
MYRTVRAVSTARLAAAAALLFCILSVFDRATSVPMYVSASAYDLRNITYIAGKGNESREDDDSKFGVEDGNIHSSDSEARLRLTD